MDWSTCSPDIILLIFKFLDHKSLVNCFSVCRLWRNVVDYIGEVNDLWPNLAQNAMYNSGITFKQKSILPWRDLYFNSLLWNNGNVHLQLDNNLEMDFLKHIHIFEDNLIVILNAAMKHYKVDTLIQVLEENYVVDFQQTQHITAKLLVGNFLSVKFGKRQKEFTTSGHKFKLVDDCCFVIDSQNVLSVIKCRGNNLLKSTIMRSYDRVGSICSINIYNDEIYLLKQNGNIIRADDWQFVGKTVGKINSPHFYNSPSVLYMFLKHSVIYSVRSENGPKYMEISEIGDTGEIVVESSGLTCATSHGDLLFLGYEDGEVNVYLSKKMLRSKEPHFTFNIKDIANHTLTDLKIKAIEVYEANESHYLFIATQCVLMKVIVTHKS